MVYKDYFGWGNCILVGGFVGLLMELWNLLYYEKCISEFFLFTVTLACVITVAEN